MKIEVNKHTKGDLVSHLYNHYALGIILEVDERQNRYVVQWHRGPTLDHPGFILKPAIEYDAKTPIRGES